MGLGLGVVATLAGVLLAAGPFDLPGPLDPHAGRILALAGLTAIVLALVRHRRRHALG
jgi:hypothetical protein